MKTRNFLALTALIFGGSAAAQVPQMINYQGRVAVGGVNFEGTGQFKFALVDSGTNTASAAQATAFIDGLGRVKIVAVTFAGSGYTTTPVVTFTDPAGLGSGAVGTAVVGAGGAITAINVTNGGSNYGPPGPTVTIADPPPNYVYNTFWSNDGSVFIGSLNTEPATAVPLTVTKGLYSVALGDINLSNMTAIPLGAFNNADVRLRVWFNDGTHESQLLAPDQRIAAVGYALTAATVSDGAITATKIATGAVGTAQLASNAVTTANVAAGAIGNANLANSSIILSAGTGLTGGGTVALGGNVSLANAGVLSLAGGGGISVSGATGAITLGSTATSENKAGAIVARDSEGSFSAGSVTLAGNLNLPTTTGTAGIIYANGAPLLHSYGTNNCFAGFEAGNLIMTGSSNTANGAYTLYSNTTGNLNAAGGAYSLEFNTTGSANAACGVQALQFNTTGSLNTGGGYRALRFNTTGGANTAFGAFALQSLQAGDNNLALGRESGFYLLQGSNNVYVANGGADGDNNIIRIGGQGYHVATYIAGIWQASADGAVPVYVQSDGKLGTQPSSMRFKENVQSMDDASAAILSLRPVTFRYNPERDPAGRPQFGLIAEEVEKVSPDLVVRDATGDVYSVRYEAVNAMLLNEFLKEYQRVEDLEKRLADLEAKDKEREARFARLERLVPDAPEKGN